MSDKIDFVPLVANHKGIYEQYKVDVRHYVKTVAEIKKDTDSRVWVQRLWNFLPPLNIMACNTDTETLPDFCQLLKEIDAMFMGCDDLFLATMIHQVTEAFNRATCTEDVTYARALLGSIVHRISDLGRDLDALETYEEDDEE